MKKLVLLSAIAVSTLFANPVADATKAVTKVVTDANKTEAKVTKAGTETVAKAKAEEKAAKPEAKK